MFFTNKLYLINLFILTISCADDKNKKNIDENEIEAIFKDSKIQKDELSETSEITPIEPTDVGLRINSISSFFLNEPDSETSDSEDCFAAEMSNLLSQSGNRFVKFEKAGSIDPAFCNDGETSFSKYDYQISVVLSCESSDLSSHNGKSWKVLSAEWPELCSEDKTRYYLFKIKSEMQFSVSSTISYQINSLLTLSTEDGGPCQEVFENGVITEDGCVNLSKLSYVRKAEESGQSPVIKKYFDYEKMISKELKSKRGDKISKFYTSGKFLVTLNNWTGEVQYLGQDTSPSWTLSAGTQKLTGTFEGPQKK